ncbi:glutathione S-transferase family protein [Methylobacterium sp. J-076]|uniref:glutathione S-transferase family protein n=1 Tax=Methylobacterium sp. J-076 TaxID=2836655 RepID=UPI001FB91802|nr:glutathione S-transferase family protein [Methylobacterium sp. J-076]MCJ2011760.1 glutathione S-transferase family protein [Methylobacterium sp. J-076]
MKFYWGPHTCAIGIHILLEEIGVPYESEKLDVAGGAAQQEPFKSINPKGKVPTLVRDDGTVMTEYGAIATWLARTNPDKGLIPADPEAERRGLEIMDYAIGTLHLQGFGRLFKTELYEPQDMVHQTLKLGQDSVKRQGRQIIDQALAILDREMVGRPYVAGETLTLGDTALFYAERWAPQEGIALPPHLAAHFERMIARPAVARVRAVWGEA